MSCTRSSAGKSIWLRTRGPESGTGQKQKNHAQGATERALADRRGWPADAREPDRRLTWTCAELGLTAGTIGPDRLLCIAGVSGSGLPVAFLHNRRGWSRVYAAESLLIAREAVAALVGLTGPELSRAVRDLLRGGAWCRCGRRIGSLSAPGVLDTGHMRCSEPCEQRLLSYPESLATRTRACDWCGGAGATHTDDFGGGYCCPEHRDSARASIELLLGRPMAAAVVVERGR